MHMLKSNILALCGLLLSVSAAPVSSGTRQLKVLKTTTTSNGQTVDWIAKDSQGDVASPPAPLRTNVTVKPAMAAYIAGLPKGPEGTVPVLRSNGRTLAKKGRPQARDNESQRRAALEDRQSDAGIHWYVSTAEVVSNYGGIGTFSIFDAYVESSGDFSLLQTAVISTTGTANTVEAGWINYPDQVSAPHLFSFFTTNDYAEDGDNIGGWNLDQAGFIQTDDTYYPGQAFAPLSTIDGSQYELEIGYFFSGGNWWLWVLDRYVGYYPGSLFSGLATESNEINFYGEIYNSETTETTTDMGSGEFADTGFGYSGYIHNIEYYDTSSDAIAYVPNSGDIISDTSRYTISEAYNSGTTWGSYFYLGGPGAGGVVGG